MKLRIVPSLPLIVVVCVLQLLALPAVSQAAQVAKTEDKNHSGNTNRESFERLKEQAEAAMDADRTPDAIRLYRRATKLRPRWSEGWWHLGTLLFDAQRFQEASDAFGQFLVTERKQPAPGFAMLGLSELQLKHYGKALAAMERSISLKPGLGSDPEFLRKVQLSDGMLNTLLGKPEIGLERLTLAANRIAAGNPAAPIDAVFSDLELLDAMGTAALRIAKLPSDLDPQEVSLVREAGRAQAFIALQDRMSAEKVFQQMLASYPNEPGVHYMYGVYLLRDSPERAVTELRREIEVSPKHDAARIQLALEFLRTADYEQGLTYATEAVALAPENFVAHLARGRLLLARERTADSISELRTAVKLAPGSPAVHFALAQALSDAGQKPEAARERLEFERLDALSDKTEH